MGTLFKDLLILGLPASTITFCDVSFPNRERSRDAPECKHDTGLGNRGSTLSDLFM